MYFLILYSGCNKNLPFIYSVHTTFDQALQQLQGLTTKLIWFELDDRDDLSDKERKELEDSQFQERNLAEFYTVDNVVAKLLDPLMRNGFCGCEKRNIVTIVHQPEGNAIKAMDIFMDSDIYTVSC